MNPDAIHSIEPVPDMARENARNGTAEMPQMANSVLQPAYSSSPISSVCSSPDLSGSSDRISYQQSVKNINNMEAQGGNLCDRAMGLFARLWTEKFGAKYIPEPGAKTQLGFLLQKIPRENLRELPAAISAYLADAGFPVQQGHSLRYFASSGGFNKYRVASNGKRSAAQPLPYDAPKTSQARGWQPNGERRLENKAGVRGQQTELSELLEEKLGGK